MLSHFYYSTKLFLLTICLTIPGCLLMAQQVDICLLKIGNQLQVYLTVDANFQGVCSNIQFTIKASQLGIAYDSLTQPTVIQQYLPCQFLGSAQSYNGSTYQKVISLGEEHMSVFNQTWQGTQTFLIARIYPSNIAANFEIVSDNWTTENNGEYYAELDASDHTGQINHLCSAVLPLEVDLVGSRELNGNKLFWRVKNELTTEFYEIQRSIDGSLFQLVAPIKANRSLDGEGTYTFLDEANTLPLEEKIYYRVAVVDQNGAYAYSNTIELTNSSAEILYHPNPVKDWLTIQIPGEKQGPLEVSVVNSQGQILISQKIESDDTNSYKLNLERLSSGVYFIDARLEGRYYAIKISKI